MKLKVVSFRKLRESGFSHHFILPVIVVVAVVGIGMFTFHAIHAATAQYYVGSCVTSKTLSTTTNSTDLCVFNAQALMNGVEHHQVTYGNSYRTAVSAGSGTTFKYGKDTKGNAVWYLAMTRKFNADTATAVKRMTGSTSLTSGTTGTWQTLCKAAAADGFSINKNEGANPLNFKNVTFPNGTKVPTTQASTNGKMYLVFQGACGKLTLAKSSTGTTGTSGSPSAPSPTPNPSPTPSSPSTSSGTPYAPALSAYKTVAQTYTFTNQQTVTAWANYADQSGEGGNTCSPSNATYDAANSAAKLTTTGSGSSCGHLRAPLPSPTKNSVLESRILMPGSSSTHMLDWGSYWTDGANQNTSDPNAGASNENWPKDGEVDAVETQYGQSYVSIHCACRSDYNASTNSSTVWTTEPSGWEGSNVSYVSPVGSNIAPVWTTVDIEFKSDGSVNIYYNGTLFTTITASAGKTSSWNTGYMYATWGIGPPGASSSSWPGGAGSEEVQYYKVFTP